MNRDFINSAAKWGLLLGAVLSVSRVYESGVMISGDMTKFAILTLEWIAVLILYIYIIVRANRAQAASALPENGYTMRQAINYSIMISALAAIIVGIVSHIYTVNVIGGYDVYAKLSVESMRSVLQQADVSSNISALYDEGMQSIEAIGENPPNIFSTTISMVANYIISGLFVGLIAGFFTRRAPEVKNIEENE